MDQNITPLRGLWRSSNPLTAPLGSCSVLDNCCIRQPGVIEPMPDITDISWSPAGTAVRMWETTNPDDLLALVDVSGTLRLYWVDKAAGTSVECLLPDGNPPTWEEGAATLVEYRGRYYLTSGDGLLVFGTIGASPHKAGMPQPQYVKLQSEDTSSAAQAVADTKYAGYQWVLEMEHTDGSLVVSAPTSPLVYENDTGSTANPTFRVYWSGAAGEPWDNVLAGHYVAMYRTDSADTNEVGAVYRLAKRIELASADISAEYVDIADDTPDAQLGAELYTNPGQKGSVKAHYPPPYLRDIVYLNGSFLGIAYEEAQSVTLAVPGRMGTVASDGVPERTTCVGRRRATGDTSSGTNTILNVSATDMTGIVVGQVVVHVDFPTGTQVTGATGSTITVDNNATGTTVGANVDLLDVIEIDGTERALAYPSTWVEQDLGVNVIAQLSAPAPLQGTATTGGYEVALRRPRATYSSTAITYRGTSESNYSPAIPALTGSVDSSNAAIQGNRIAWSEPDQPDHWPLVNRLTFGERELVRLVRAGDSAYAFSTDSRVYRISGAGDSWRVDEVAENITLLSTGAVAVNAGTIYAWTDRGVVAIRDGYVQSLTDARLVDDFRLEQDTIATNETPPWTWHGWMTYDRFNSELWLTCSGTSDRAFKPWIYNTMTDEWYRFDGGLGAVWHMPLYVATKRVVYLLHWDAEGGYTWYRFVAPTSAAKVDGAAITLNHIDAGAAGALKQWREVVARFGADATGNETFDFTTTADDQAGGGTDTTSYTVSLSATSPAMLACHVARDSAMSTQLEIALDFGASTTAWELHGLVVRFALLTDRTGGRAA